MSAVPLRAARLASLAFLFAWGVIGGSVGLNGLIKSNQQKSSLRKSVPAGASINIDTNDVYQTGVVITTLCALLAVLSLIFAIPLLVPSVPFLHRRALAFLRVKGAILAFVAVWLLATLIPFDHFYATRQAKVTASIGGVSLPQSVIQQVESSLGTTGVYNKIHYLTLVAILPWFTFLAAIIASALFFAAASRSPVAAMQRAPVGDTEHLDEKKAGETPV